MSASLLERDLLGIPYSRVAGPLHPNSLLYGLKPESANCQRAVQLFYLWVMGILLSPQEALSQEGSQLGIKFTPKLGTHPYADLKFGDIIYAYPLNQPKTIEVGHPRDQILHQAVFLGKPTDEIVLHNFPGVANTFASLQLLVYHATFWEGQSTIWSVNKFQEYYLPDKIKLMIPR